MIRPDWTPGPDDFSSSPLGAMTDRIRAGSKDIASIIAEFDAQLENSTISTKTKDALTTTLGYVLITGNVPNQ